MHTVFRVWAEYFFEEKDARKTGKHDHVLEKTLMQWGKGDAALLLHTVFRGWAEYLSEEKDARKAAQFRDNLKSTHGKHDHVLEKTLMQWGKGDAALLLHTMVRVWTDFLIEAKDAMKAAQF